MTESNTDNIHTKPWSREETRDIKTILWEKVTGRHVAIPEDGTTRAGWKQVQEVFKEYARRGDHRTLDGFMEYLSKRKSPALENFLRIGPILPNDFYAAEFKEQPVSQLFIII